MIAIRFDRAYAEQVLDAVRNDRPIPVPGGGWTQNASLALAGMVAAAAKSHGPQQGAFHGSNFDEFRKQHPERQEAVQDTFRSDLLAGIDFLSELTLAVADGEYDLRFEKQVVAGVAGTPDGRTAVVPGSGFKAR